MGAEQQGANSEEEATHDDSQGPNPDINDGDINSGMTPTMSTERKDTKSQPSAGCVKRGLLLTLPRRGKDRAPSPPSSTPWRPPHGTHGRK